MVNYVQGDADKMQWGAQLKTANESIVEIKLLLDTSQKMPWHVPQEAVASSLMLLPPSKTAQDVAADFLRALKSHAMAQIEKRMTLAVLETFETEYIMSGAGQL